MEKSFKTFIRTLVLAEVAGKLIVTPVTVDRDLNEKETK
jgi:hypothetical protein